MNDVQENINIHLNEILKIRQDLKTLKKNSTIEENILQNEDRIEKLNTSTRNLRGKLSSGMNQAEDILIELKNKVEGLNEINKENKIS